MDKDIGAMSRAALEAEVRRLRQGIRVHRDSTGQDLCWHHPALWGLLPERTDPVLDVPPWPEFMRGCVHYRESLDRAGASVGQGRLVGRRGSSVSASRTRDQGVR